LRLSRNAVIYLLILVAVVAIFFTLVSPGGGPEPLSLNKLVAMAQRGDINGDGVFDALDVEGFVDLLVND